MNWWQYLPFVVIGGVGIFLWSVPSSKMAEIEKRIWRKWKSK